MDTGTILMSGGVSIGICFMSLAATFVFKQRDIDNSNQNTFLSRNEYNLFKEHVHHELNELKTDVREVLKLVSEIKEKL